MRKSLLLLALPVLALGAAPHARAAGDPAATIDAFHSALKRGDATGAISLLMPEATIFEQGFYDHSRNEYAGPHAASDAAFAQATDYTVQDRKILWLGSSAACVISQTRATGTYEGNPINLQGTETALLARAGDGWAIQHIHWSAHPGDVPAAPAPSPAPKGT